MKQLPAALRDPIWVFDSASNPNSVVVVTELRIHDRNILASVHLDAREKNHQVNLITSAYQKDNPRIFAQWMEQGLLRYTHQAKSLSWFRSARLQLPREGSTKGNPKLLTEVDLVKSDSGRGLAAASPNETHAQKGIELERVPKFVALAKMILGKGIETPEALAEFLVERKNKGTGHLSKKAVDPPAVLLFHPTHAPTPIQSPAGTSARLLPLYHWE